MTPHRLSVGAASRPRTARFASWSSLLHNNCIPVRAGMARITASLLLVGFGLVAQAAELRGTGDLGIAIERAKGSLQWLDTTKKVSLGRIEGLGDLSHASAVFSRDARHAYVFGRDGGLTKVDILTGQVAKRIIQSGNSIGGAISQDGR